MNADLLDLVAAFVNDRETRERMGYDVDTCVRRRIKPIPLPPSVHGAHLSIMWRERRNAYVRSIGTNYTCISILDNINGIVVKIATNSTSLRCVYSMSVTTGVEYSALRSTEDHLVAVGTSSTCVCRNTFWDERSVYGPSHGRYVGPGEVVFLLNYIRYKLE
jgi:hypothetical protein